MKLRQHLTSLALILAAAGALLAFLLDRGRVTDTERRDRDHDVFPAYRRSDIDRIELTQGKATIRIERRPGAGDGGEASWHLASPVDETADPAAVDQLVGDLEFAGVIRRVEASVAGGFDAPRLTGTLSMKPLVYHFALGGPAPTPEGSAYFRVDGEGTFVVSRDFVKALTSQADTYRNRTVVPYLSLDLAHLELDTPGRHFTLDRADEISFRFADTRLRASRTALDRVWGALAEARIETFLTDAEADAALGPTPLRVVMTPKDTNKPAGELVVGGACPGHPESIVLVRRSPTRASGCIPRGSRAGLEIPRDELIDRRLFASRADEVEEVVIETVPPGTAIELARKGRGWHERKPSERALEGAEATAANELVTRLTQGEGTRITAAGEGTSQAPRARARLKRGGSSVEEVVELLAEPGLARRAFDGAVLQLSPALAHRLWPSEIALRGAAVYPNGFAGQRPMAVTVRCDGLDEAALRDVRDGQWRLREPHGYLADQLAISDLAGLVENAQADSWIADKDDGSFGFSDHSCEVDVDVASEAGSRKIGLLFGKETADGEVYAHPLSEAAVFLAPRLLRQESSPVLIDRGGFRADPASVVEVELSSGNSKRTLRATDTGAHDAGGHDPFSRVVAALETLRPDAVVHLGSARPSEGLANPTLEVRVRLRSDAGVREIHFRLGDTATVERHRVTFARLADVDATFEIAHDHLQPLVDAL